MQLTVFDELYKELPTWNGTLKLGTFFSGIGSPEKALRNIGIDYDLQFFSEIDKYAIESYMAVHSEPKDKWVGSITDLKGVELPYCDMWFGGFPCQDISLAGKGKGFSIESESRSSLGWEMIRLLREVAVKPKYVVFENVAAIFNETHRPVLNLFKQDLEALGYTLFDDLLNAKNYGIPQNRNRYFLVAILGEYNYKFPKPIKLELRLKDMLEKEIDEKYYLSDKILEFFKKNSKEQQAKGNGFKFEPTNGDSIAKAITTRNGSRMDDNFIKVPEATTKGYSEATDGDGIYLDRPHQKRGVVQKGMIPTLKCSGNDLGVVTEELRIRKLTPLECWRLMGFTDEDFNKTKVSNAQLYKQAGNSIVVNVLEAIFKNLLGGNNEQT